MHMTYKVSILRLAVTGIISSFAACFVGVRHSSAEPLNELYELLESRSISFDREKVNEAAFGAALLYIDPHASLVVADTNAPTALNETELIVDYWSQGIGYLSVPALSLAVASNVVAQVAEWDKSTGVGVILDLRGSGGMDYQAAALIAGMVVGHGEQLFGLRDLADTEFQKVYASEGAGACGTPLVVLVDGNTHDASEVLAAVLKNRVGAMLIGCPTRGDSMVREQVRITERLSVVIAHARVGFENQYDYEGLGVVPDVVLRASLSAPHKIDVSSAKGLLGRPLSAKALEDRDLMKRTENDVVLRRATDILLGLKALGEFDGSHLGANTNALSEHK